MRYTYFPGGPTCPPIPCSRPLRDILTQRVDRATGGAEASKTTWRAWKARHLPAYSHAIFQGGCKSADAHAVTGFSIDQDNLAPGTVEAVAQRCGLEYYRWDTPSKQLRLKEHAYRYLLPFPEALPVSATSYRQLWSDLTAFFGATNDPQTSDVSRKMFLPVWINGVSPRLVYQPGAPLDTTRIPRHSAGEEPRPDTQLVTLPTQQLTRALDLLIKSQRDLPTRLALQALRRGEEFAGAGQRHAAILTLTRLLVAALPTVSTACLAGLFERSLAASPDTDQTLRDVSIAIDGARAKFTSGRRKRAAALIRAARTDGLAHEYTAGERREMAAVQGVLADELPNQILVYRGNEIYALTHRTGYEGPYLRHSDALFAQVLAPWGLSDSARRALDDHGIAAKSVIYSLALKRSVYNAHTGTLRLASAAPEILYHPVEHLDVAEWLDSFRSSKLLDWLACAPDPHKAVCALGIFGPKNTGKNLLATGISRLWGDGTPASPREILETNYDVSLGKNAVLHFDEYTPNKYERPITAVLREMIGAHRRCLSVKYAQPITLEGCTRVILTGNDRLPLVLNEELGRQGQEALAERILVIEASDDVPRTLARFDAASFDLHKIAEHVLWLAATRTVHKDTRFWVSGNMQQMLTRLVVENRPTANVAEWLVRFVLGATQLPEADAVYWGRAGERLAVSVELLNRRWGLYRDDRYKPSPSTVRDQLSVLSVTGKTERAYDATGTRRRLWAIDMEKLVSVADSLGICERAELEAALREKIKSPATQRLSIN